MSFVVRRRRPEDEVNDLSPMERALDRVLTRIAFGILTAIAGALGGWWSFGHIGAAVCGVLGLLIGLALGDRTPYVLLWPW